MSGSGSLVTKGTTTVLNGGTALVVGGSATWSNASTVLDNGSIQIGNGTLAATVANAAGAVFDIDAGNINIYNGSTPASGFVNAGTLEMTVAGTSSVGVGVTNSGTILATKGALDFSGGVTGTGALDVESGGSLGFSGTVQSTETVSFLDSTGAMAITLPSSTAFGAEINGFVAGDTIDLTNISNATGTFSGGVLTFISNSSHGTVATLHFSGTPTFAFASDGHGGTLITDPTSDSRTEPDSIAAIATHIGQTWEPPNRLEQPATLPGNGRACDKYVVALSALLQPEQYSQAERTHWFLFNHF